jgi:hypothetical protein
LPQVGAVGQHGVERLVLALRRGSHAAPIGHVHHRPQVPAANHAPGKKKDDKHGKKTPPPRVLKRYTLLRSRFLILQPPLPYSVLGSF